jgi:hypothetical protein
MPTSTAIFRQLKYKVEGSYGVIPALSGSQALRRVEFSPSLAKDTYQSNELNTTQQINDFRHGARRASGTLRGELSPKAYADFYAALVRRAWTTVTALTGMSITIAGSGPTYTVTRATGDFLAGDIKAGNVVRLTAGTFNAANINKNLFVVSLTATILTVIPLNGVALVAEGPIASATLSLTGKKTFAPGTGHTDLSYTIESWFSDITKSEMYTGMKPTQAVLNLPSTGMATTDITFMGKDMTAYGAEQFTSPTAAPTYGIAAAVNGVLRIGGVTMTVVRNLSITINGNFGGEPVVGSNTIPNQFPGRIQVTGQFTAYLDDVTLRDAFIAETEIALMVVLSSDNTATSDFIAVTLPRVKLGSADKDDAQDGITQTFSFTALYKSTGGAGADSDQTTISLQDSQA